ncbi:acyl carrier protein [Bosea sp. F3-2]|uniref:acyl carrier protein n=1 Tax=Bosea sp. F3-2 TaxID=2599640 RepID=UPI0011ECF8A9|nr:acyl carrier protein [Bosea sp. F3-2]QEL22213.1 acyl carrier protein [Bosea sp. F3-2]
MLPTFHVGTPSDAPLALLIKKARSSGTFGQNRASFRPQHGRPLIQEGWHGTCPVPAAWNGRGAEREVRRSAASSLPSKKTSLFDQGDGGLQRIHAGFRMKNLDIVKEIVAGQISRDPSEITELTSLEEAGYDSLDVLETIFAIEERFKIRVPFDANDPKIKELRTVGDIARIVDDALGERAPA